MKITIDNNKISELEGTSKELIDFFNNCNVVDVPFLKTNFNLDFKLNNKGTISPDTNYDYNDNYIADINSIDKYQYDFSGKIHKEN
jgi:hypothetical protein